MDADRIWTCICGRPGVAVYDGHVKCAKCYTLARSAEYHLSALPKSPDRSARFLFDAERWLNLLD